MAGSRLSCLNYGIGKISLFIGEGFRKAGKRPADVNEENPYGRKVKVNST